MLTYHRPETGINFFLGNLNLLSHCHAQCHFQTDANLCKLRSTDDLEHIEIDEICLRFLIFLKNVRDQFIISNYSTVHFLAILKSLNIFKIPAKLVYTDPTSSISYNSLNID